MKSTKQKFFLQIVFTICLILASTSLYSQKRPRQDVRKVTVTSQYVFENGKKTDKFWAIYQEIYDSLGRLHTEVEYNFIDHSPHNYWWHTFNGKQKTKTDIYKDEKLQSIEEFNYNIDSLLTSKVIKKIGNNDTIVFLILNYKYNSKKNPIEITAKTAGGKIAFISKSTYNEKGVELTRNVKTKKDYFPQDSILKLLSLPTYDSIGRLFSEKITTTKVNKTTCTKTIKYLYDQKNNKTQIIVLDSKGKQICREERAYNHTRNRLSEIKYYDSNNVLVNMIAKRYELYRSKNRQNREIDY